MFFSNVCMDKRIDKVDGCNILGAMNKFTRNLNLSVAAKLSVYGWCEYRDLRCDIIFMTFVVLRYILRQKR